MDANNFMTGHSSERICYKDCKDCGLLTKNGCAHLAYSNKSTTHPLTTRAALFKKTHPFVLSDSSGSLLICPVVVDKNVICPLNGECKQCRKNYWLKEV